VVTNGKPLQAVNRKSCGDYALLYLKAKARGRTLQEFLNDFSDYDYVSNDHKVGQRVKQLIVGNELVWHKVCRSPYHQRFFFNKRLKMYEWVSFISFCHAVGKIFLLSHPFQYFGSGSIGVWQNGVYGKKLLLENPELFENPPTQVHYCYGAWQDRFQPMQDRGITFHLQRRLRMLLQDQEQFAQGREIANITTTNSIVTSYKQGGRPTVQSTSSRFST